MEVPVHSVSRIVLALVLIGLWFAFEWYGNSVPVDLREFCAQPAEGSLYFSRAMMRCVAFETFGQVGYILFGIFLLLIGIHFLLDVVDRVPESNTRNREESQLLSGRALLYLLPPISALVIFSPIGLSVFEPGEMKADVLLLASPFYLGWLCAPGYIYTIFVQPRAGKVSTARRWWIRFSLIVAIAASAIGVLGGSMMILFSPPSLIALITSVILLRNFEQAGCAPKNSFHLAQASLLLLPPVLALALFTPDTLTWMKTAGSLSEIVGGIWPYFLWLLCIPGYCYAVFSLPVAQRVTPARRWWIRLSILGAMLCSSIGAVAAGFKFWLSVPTIVAFIAALYLFLNVEQRERVSEQPA